MTRDQRWLIEPNAEKGWTHERGVRRPNQVLGVLLRHHFPGKVQLPGEGEVPQVALTWELYMDAPAPPEERVDGVLCETVADIVIRWFWTFYRCLEEHEAKSAVVLIAECKCLFENLDHLHPCPQGHFLAPADKKQPNRTPRS